MERQRSPIADGGHGKPWVFRYKDLVAWWATEHFDRPGGVEAETPTAWMPRSKPIWFTELGCPAVDKGPNQPNVFPRSEILGERRPAFLQQGALGPRAAAFHRSAPGALGPGPRGFCPERQSRSRRSMGTDGRSCPHHALGVGCTGPFRPFPRAASVWADGENWQLGHWLNGRLSGIAVSDLIDAILADHGLPAADTGAVAGTLTGYVSEDPTTARAALEPLAELFGLGAHEEGGKLVFFSEARATDRVELVELVGGRRQPDQGAHEDADHETARRGGTRLS